MDERLYYLGFSLFSGIGPVTFAKLLGRFGSAKSAWDASRSDLEPFLKTLTDKFEDFKKSFPYDGYQKELKRKGVWFLALCDKEYPSLLKSIKKPPIVLYGKGSRGFTSSRAQRGDLVLEIASSQTPRNDVLSIAVVGTRKVTSYGREVTELFTRGLVQNGFTIVSGLAMGVDAVAHKTAIQHGGKTIAVLGCGVDCCTPEENTFLYDLILAKSGAIVSELPLGHPPSKGSFPARNRIIAGLSLGVLVTEGAEDSGSLITADYSLKFGRPVFAIPGPITSSLSKGPFSLIQKGGRLVTSSQDILQELKSEILSTKSLPADATHQALQAGETNSNVQNNPLRREARKFKTESKEEELILKLLENEAVQFDELVRKTQLDAGKLGGILSLLEIKGIVQSANGSYSILTILV